MKKTSYFVTLLALALAIIAVSAQVTPVTPYGDTPSNPFCAPPSSLSHTGGSLIGPTESVLDFQFSSFAVDLNTGDSTPLLLREPKDGKGWTWMGSSDNQFSQVKKWQCVGTQSDTYVKIIKHILILKKTDGSLRLCIVEASQQAQDINPVDINKNTGNPITESATKISPFFYNEVTYELYILYTDGSKTAVYKTNVYKSSPVNQQQIQGDISVSIRSGRGNANILYNYVDSKLYVMNQSDPSGLVDANSPVTPFVNGVVNSHNYFKETGILIFYNSDLTSVKVAALKGPVIEDLSFDKTSTNPFREYSDFQTGSLIIGDDSMFWVYQPYFNARVLWTITLQAADIAATGLDVSTIEHVTLSGDKVFFYYGSGKLMYWKMTASGSGKIVYQTSASGIPTTGQYMHKVSLQCLCQTIKRFFCYSSSLSCLIIKKGGNQCPFIIDSLIKLQPKK